jgi:hypothetical protein
MKLVTCKYIRNIKIRRLVTTRTRNAREISARTDGSPREINKYKASNTEVLPLLFFPTNKLTRPKPPMLKSSKQR